MSSDEPSLEERAVVALEKIAEAVSKLEFRVEMMTDRLTQIQRDVSLYIEKKFYST